MTSMTVDAGVPLTDFLSRAHALGRAVEELLQMRQRVIEAAVALEAAALDVEKKVDAARVGIFAPVEEAARQLGAYLEQNGAGSAFHFSSLTADAEDLEALARFAFQHTAKRLQS